MNAAFFTEISQVTRLISRQSARAASVSLVLLLCTMNMTFKYRIVSSSKIHRKSACLKWNRKLLLFLIVFGVLWISLQQWRISNLSKLGSMTEFFSNALKDELQRLPLDDERKDTWRMPKLDGAQIFSAYLETRPEVVLEANPNLEFSGSAWGLVRVIGIVPVVSASTPLTCYFIYKHASSKDETYVVRKPSIRTELVAFGENFGMYYSAAYILCPLPFPDELYPPGIQLPYSVTVSSNPKRGAHELMSDEFVAIRYPKNGWNADDAGFAVCVQPFHHHFDRTIDLIAFVEYYRMMGVERFTFYRDSVTHSVDEILNYYAQQNVAVVLEWRLPDFYKFERNLRVDGIYAALNDCLYRSVLHAGFRYVVGVDVDEYILPRLHSNFTQMMEYLNRDEDGCTGAWIFRNAFYYMMYDDDPVTLSSDIPKLSIHGKTQRWIRINPPYDRSKFIVQGRDVIELGNHRIWRLRKIWSIFGRRCREVAVDPEVGTSNHYRNCETEIDKCWRRETIVDRTAHRFTGELGQRVKSTYRSIFGVNAG